jgi:hypothetical protein
MLIGDAVVVDLPSRPHDERFTYTDEFDVQPLEFITITGSTTDRPDRNVSRIVRSQAMRNYVWRQNHPTLTDEMAAAAAVPLKEKPQRIFEGKFRVGSRARKQKKPSKAKRPVSAKDKGEDSMNEIHLINNYWLLRQSLMPDKNLLMRGGAFADPYDSFQFPLGPESEKFIFYCKCDNLIFYSSSLFASTTKVNLIHVYGWRKNVDSSCDLCRLKSTTRLLPWNKILISSTLIYRPTSVRRQLHRP